MSEKFAEVLTIGGKSNSLGRTEEVVQLVIGDKSRLEELYECLFEEDEWLRMRAIDALEKVCRVHPEWFESYADRFLRDVTDSTQPSIQWHLAQMFGEISLTPVQKKKVTAWLLDKIQTTEVDWIVAANVMETLAKFAREGFIAKSKLIPLFAGQQKHHSSAVVKRATKLLESLG